MSRSVGVLVVGVTGVRGRFHSGHEGDGAGAEQCRRHHPALRQPARRRHNPRRRRHRDAVSQVVEVAGEVGGRCIASIGVLGEAALHERRHGGRDRRGRNEQGRRLVVTIAAMVCTAVALGTRAGQ